MRKFLPALMVLCLILAVCIDALAALPGALGSVVQPGQPVAICGTPSDPDQDCDGYSINQGDCNDIDATINPRAPEVCDGIDNDCDGLIDGPDNDFDNSPQSCDCDDNDAMRRPGSRAERYEAHDGACDGIDNDCNGVVDGACNTEEPLDTADSAVNDTDDTDVPTDSDTDAGGDSDVPSRPCEDWAEQGYASFADCAKDEAEARGLCTGASTLGAAGKSFAPFSLLMLLGLRRRTQ